MRHHGYLLETFTNNSTFCAVNRTFRKPWTILDLEVQRWYTIQHSEENLGGERDIVSDGFVSADGGFCF